MAHAIAAMQLHRLVDDLLRLIRGKELGHSRLAGDARRAGILGPGGAVDQQRRSVDVQRHIGDVPLYHLQIEQRRALHMAGRDPVQRLIQRPARKAECCRSDGGAEHIQHAHGDFEALTALAEHGTGRNAAIGKAERGQRVRRDHLQPLHHLEPRQARRHHKS